MTPVELAIAALLSGLGAWVNAVAGGGTFLVFPFLTFVGLSALQANVISTMALWPGVLASTIAYRHQLSGDIPAKLPLIGASLLGSLLGTLLLLFLPESYFETAVPWLLVFAALLLSLGPQLKKRWTTNAASLAELSQRHIQWMVVCQFVIAIYGGYFGAGIGILMLAVLQFAPFRDIHQANALKVILGTTINAVAFFIFAFSGHVIWPIALTMLVGGVVGGYVGTRIALKIDPIHMRRIVLFIAWATTAAYFYKHYS